MCRWSTASTTVRPNPWRSCLLTIAPRTGSGAERAGIEGIHRNRFGQVEIGDTVIALDGQEVTSSADLILMLEKRKPGERVRLTLERNGRRREVESELGSSRE